MLAELGLEPFVAGGQGRPRDDQRHVVHERLRLAGRARRARAGLRRRPLHGDGLAGADGQPRPLQRLPLRGQAAPGDHRVAPPTCGCCSAGSALTHDAEEVVAARRRRLPRARRARCRTSTRSAAPRTSRARCATRSSGSRSGSRSRSTRPTTTRCSTPAPAACRAAATSTAATSRQAMDALKIALANMCDLFDRQLELIVDEKFNAGLTPEPDPVLRSQRPRGRPASRLQGHAALVLGADRRSAQAVQSGEHPLALDGGPQPGQGLHGDDRRARRALDRGDPAAHRRHPPDRDRAGPRPARGGEGEPEGPRGARARSARASRSWTATGGWTATSRVSWSSSARASCQPSWRRRGCRGRPSLARVASCVLLCRRTGSPAELTDYLAARERRSPRPDRAAGADRFRAGGRVRARRSSAGRSEDCVAGAGDVVAARSSGQLVLSVGGGAVPAARRARRLSRWWPRPTTARWRSPGSAEEALRMVVASCRSVQRADRARCCRTAARASPRRAAAGPRSPGSPAAGRDTAVTLARRRTRRASDAHESSSGRASDSSSAPQVGIGPAGDADGALVAIRSPILRGCGSRASARARRPSSATCRAC